MKKFISGFICCFILMTGIAYAASQLKADIAPFKIFLDGKEFKPSNPAVVIDGRTYLPLRSMGEALGAKINWNESKRQVEIGEPPKEEPSPTVAPTPSTITLGKNEFITHENPPRFKITVLGQLPSNREGFEVWQFRVENISVYNSDFRGSGIGANFGAENPGFEAQYLKENTNYKVIGRQKLKPGEAITGIVGYQVNRSDTQRDFGYNGAGVIYEK